VAKKKTTTTRTRKKSKKTTASRAAKAATRKSTSKKKTAKRASKKTARKAPSKRSAAGRRKTYLTAAELRKFRNLLLAKRIEILGDMDSMARDALNADSANLSHMPIHMADVGSDNHEQELTLGLVESERKLVREINEALLRIAEGTYGMCESTGKRINKARLNAKPWAKYCIEAAREMERMGNGG